MYKPKHLKKSKRPHGGLPILSAVFTILVFTFCALATQTIYMQEAWAARIPGQAYRQKHTTDCVLPEDNDTSSRSDSASDAPVGGDWLTEGTDAYNNAKQMFDALTGDYGWSGVAACGALGNVTQENTSWVLDLKQGGERLGMNNKGQPEADGHACGLFQFDPYYEVFSNTEYWQKYDSEGWGLKNQLAKMWDWRLGGNPTECEAGLNYYAKRGLNVDSTIEQMFAEDDLEKAMYNFYAACERAGTPVFENRLKYTQAANSVFNKDNIQADETKWNMDTSTSGVPVIDGSTNVDDQAATQDCIDTKRGIDPSDNDVVKRILTAAKTVESPGAGLCAAWVGSVYEEAGFTNPGGNACDMYDSFCTSSNRDDLQPGMAIAVSSHSKTPMGKTYGHIGIYMGDNKVRHNIGSIEEQDLDDWISFYGDTVDVKWGYPADVASAIALASGDIDASEIAKKVIEAAKSKLGSPYVLGAAGPDTFDCSGLVVWSFREAAGMNLPHSAASLAGCGTKVSLENAVPGDLLVWAHTEGGSASGSHVAIYEGANQMIHAIQPVSCETNLDNWSNKNFIVVHLDGI